MARPSEQPGEVVRSLWRTGHHVDQIGYQVTSVVVPNAGANVADGCAVNEFGPFEEQLELPIEIRLVVSRDERHPRSGRMLHRWVSFQVVQLHELTDFIPLSDGRLPEVDLESEVAEFVLQVELKTAQVSVPATEHPDVVHPPGYLGAMQIDVTAEQVIDGAEEGVRQHG